MCSRLLGQRLNKGFSNCSLIDITCKEDDILTLQGRPNFKVFLICKFPCKDNHVVDICQVNAACGYSFQKIKIFRILGYLDSSYVKLNHQFSFATVGMVYFFFKFAEDLFFYLMKNNHFS